MATHLPSCHVSRAWRGEKARYVFYQKEGLPPSRIDQMAQTLREGSGDRPEDFRESSNRDLGVLFWEVVLWPKEFQRLEEMPEFMDYIMSINTSCACYDPTSMGDWDPTVIIDQVRDEERAGWPPGAPYHSWHGGEVLEHKVPNPSTKL